MNEPGNIVGLLCSTNGLLQVSDHKFKARHITWLVFFSALIISASANFFLIDRELDITKVGILPDKYDKVKGGQGV